MEKAPSLIELFAPMGRMYERLEKEDRARYEKWVFAVGVRVVAEEIAKDRGLSGRAFGYFVDGFTGVHAAFSNPRQDGMGPVFREGRMARQGKGIANRCRAAAEIARTHEKCSFRYWIAHPWIAQP